MFLMVKVREYKSNCVIRFCGSTVIIAGASHSRVSPCLGGWEMEECAAAGLGLGYYYDSDIEDYSRFWYHLVGRMSRSPHAIAKPCPSRLPLYVSTFRLVQAMEMFCMFAQRNTRIICRSDFRSANHYKTEVIHLNVPSWNSKSYWELRGPGTVSWIPARPIRPIPNAMFLRLWAQLVPLRTLLILRQQRISVNYQNLHRQQFSARS